MGAAPRAQGSGLPPTTSTFARRCVCAGVDPGPRSARFGAARRRRRGERRARRKATSQPGRAEKSLHEPWSRQVRVAG